MHKLAPARARRPARQATTRPHLSASHVVRPAHAGDVGAIHAIVRRYAAQGHLLPRTRRDILAAIGDYVVVMDDAQRVVGCAALAMYSAALAEVTSVAVARSAQGRGVGTLAVRGVEGLARDRGIVEVFAMTSAEAFFASLGYERSSVEQYPEKLARYEVLRANGVQVVERACYRKLLTWADRARPKRAARPRRPTSRPATPTAG